MNATPSTDSRRGHASALREVALVMLGVTLGSVALDQLTRLPGLHDYTHLAVGSLMLIVAVHMAGRAAGDLQRYGMALGGVLDPGAEAPRPGLWGALVDLTLVLVRALPSALRETAFVVGLCILVFPPFVVGFQLWHEPVMPFSASLPEALPSYLASQVLVVALPEEALFRGYIQGRLGEAWPARAGGIGPSLGAVVGQAALFAVLHFAVNPNPVRLAVFFPGLAFGWLRGLRGGIGAPIVFHVACNLLSDVLVTGFL